MLQKVIDLSEKIGNKLANLKLGNTFSVKDRESVIYQIKPFRDNENGIAYWMGFLSNFSDISEEITFFVKGHSKDIRFYVQVPKYLKAYFENTFYSNFSTSDLILEKYIKNLDINGSNIRFVDGDILTDKDFTKDGVYLDPIKEICSIFYDIPEKSGELVFFYNFIFNEKTFFLRKWIKKAWKSIRESEQSLEGENLQDGKSKQISGFRNLKLSIGYKCISKDETIKISVKKNITSTYNKFIKKGKILIKNTPKFYEISMEQAVNFFHIPTKEFFIKNLDYIGYRKLPYPPLIPSLENTETNDITLLGYTDYKNDNVKFGIRREDKFRHVYIIGKTGMGKSTLMSNMARSDMVTNNGLTVIDPHGDLIETLLEHVPSYRTNDVILFDVADAKYPIGFNILEYKTEEEKNLVVSGIVSIFKKLYGNSWGPRLEYILRNVMLSIVEYPYATLLHLTRMLTDKNFKEEVLEYVKDPIVLKFWREEFDKWTDKFKDEAISPIVNKVGQFLSSPLMRNIFGQSKSKLNFRSIMDEGKVLLINLSKGRIGEDNANMVGSFIVTKFQIDAMSRADIPADKRKDFFLYIDEFQNFATESFESILSEARKYKLSLILANQYITQIDEIVRNAIFGNVGTIITFALGHDDAILMSNQFKGIITPNDILSVPKFRAYIKLMTDGITSDPFGMTTFPLPKPQTGEEISDKIRKQSRQRYGTEREKLNSIIAEWSQKTFSKVEKVMEKAKAQGQQAQPVGKTDNNSTEATKISGGGFSINDVKVGETYEGLVKLKYNYGLFVTVKGVEGLLHKKMMKVNDGIRWKDLYNIGDKIQVKAHEFKDVEGEKRIVWTQID